MEVTGIDHIVLYATDIEHSCTFYADILDVAVVEEFDNGRVALSFGTTKLNLHPAGDEYIPHAAEPTPGAADFCLIVDEPIESVEQQIEKAGVEIAEGPVRKVGARGPMQSVYVHDPDGNLVEFARYEGQD